MYIWKERDSKNAIITDSLDNIHDAHLTDGISYIDSYDISEYITASGISDNETVKFNKRNVITLTIKKRGGGLSSGLLGDPLGGGFAVTNLTPIPGTKMIMGRNGNVYLTGNKLLNIRIGNTYSFVLGKKLSYDFILPLAFKFNFEGINTDFDEEPICDGIVDFNFVYDSATNTVRNVKETDFDGSTDIWNIACEEYDNVYSFPIYSRKIYSGDFES